MIYLFADSSNMSNVEFFRISSQLLALQMMDNNPPARLRGRDGVLHTHRISQPSLNGFINIAWDFLAILAAKGKKKLEGRCNRSRKLTSKNPLPLWNAHITIAAKFLEEGLSAPPYGQIIRYLHRTMENCEPDKWIIRREWPPLRNINKTLGNRDDSAYHPSLCRAEEMGSLLWRSDLSFFPWANKPWFGYAE